jgi:hypothetical protein
MGFGDLGIFTTQPFTTSKLQTSRGYIYSPCFPPDQWSRSTLAFGSFQTTGIFTSILLHYQTRKVQDMFTRVLTINEKGVLRLAELGEPCLFVGLLRGGVNW